MKWKERIAVGLIKEANFYGYKIRIYADRIAIQSEYEEPLSWETLQYIKNHFLGDVVAFEIYPKEDDVVNLRNTRHLWYGYLVEVKDHPEFKEVTK